MLLYAPLLDQVIAAIGQEPNVGALGGELAGQVQKDGRLRADPTTLATELTGVFAAGDVVTGAATVIAAAVTLRRLAPDLPVLAVAPCVENMPGPHSARPGDVVRALNGKAVEIQNTDAEGRLILGDALTYAERLGATHLVDLATLTGAVERAFGKLVTGGFGTPQWWWDAVAAAGARQGERHWQIPLVDDYVPDLESWYADFLNTGGNEGALVKSGLFLREFVTRPWVHLDIAGSAYLRKATPWAARGATGVAHATIVELALEGA
jgi:leucyl aminopeptidase